MSTLSTYGYAYLNVRFNGLTHEVGVSYLSWPAPNITDRSAVCVDLVAVYCEVSIPEQFVKSALKNHLKHS